MLHLHGASEVAALGESVQQRLAVFGEVVKLGLSNLRLRDSLRGQALRAVAQVLDRAIRSSDMACRYGGDEFMCLLPGMTAPDAAKRFERALRQLSEDAGALPRQGETITFTVGVASAPGCGTDAATLTSAADAALYVAKEKGRNRVEIASPAGVTLEKLVG